jgi:hypothetical protein
VPRRRAGDLARPRSRCGGFRIRRGRMREGEGRDRRIPATVRDPAHSVRGPRSIIGPAPPASPGPDRAGSGRESGVANGDVASTAWATRGRIGGPPATTSRRSDILEPAADPAAGQRGRRQDGGVTAGPSGSRERMPSSTAP